MAENTKIEWCDHTFNPWTGCTKVSPACDNCYAEAWAKRSGHVQWGAGQPRRRTSDANWRMPLKWSREAERTGVRPRVFCASLADVFDNEVDPAWRADLFRLIADTPKLDWLLLTKRIGNARTMMADALHLESSANLDGRIWPLPNVWLGATVVNQEEADRDIPKLLAVPAAKRFLSIEPMLGPMLLPFERLREWNRIALLNQQEHAVSRIDWVIVGGESGHGARPMHPDWVRSVRNQCAAVGVPFLFKQWGSHDLSYDRDRDDPDYRRCSTVSKAPGRWINLAGGHGFGGERVHYARRVDKSIAGRLLDGRTWNEVPAC